MPKNNYLNIDEKEKILKFLNENKSLREISRNIGRSHNVVRNFFKSPMRYGTAILKAGRKPKLSKRDERIILKDIGLKEMSLREAANNFTGDVSASTICRLMKKSNYKFMKMNICPQLNKVQKERRIEFSKNMLLRGENYYKNIVFSDEKKFTIYGPDGYRGYWRDLRKQPEYFCKQKYALGIMVWGAISINGTVSLSFVEGSINSEKYQNILSKELLPIISDGNYVFQQDNASCHTSKSTKKWLSDNQICTMDWPANSPDLNLIENIWGVLVRRIYKNRMTYSSLEDLKNIIIKEWEKLEKSLFENLYKSFSDRLFDVITSKGCII